MARSHRITLIAILAFIGATVGLVSAEGLILSRDWVFAWAMLGLLAISLSDVKRWLRGLVFDWLPFAAMSNDKRLRFVTLSLLVYFVVQRWTILLGQG